jgi:leucyl aminopeptidase
VNKSSFKKYFHTFENQNKFTHSLSMTMIKKSNINVEKDNLVILSTSTEKIKGYGLSKEQLTYIATETKLDKKVIQLNCLNRFVFIVAVDNKKEDYKRKEQLRRLACTVNSVLNSHHLQTVSLIAETKHEDDVLAFAEGLMLANYQFIQYKSKQDKNSLTTVIVDNLVSKNKLEELNITLEAVYESRNLVNEPANKLNAVDLANRFKKMAAKAGFSIQVFNKQKITALKMGGLLAVNKGSVDPPTFSIMEYKHKNAKNKKPYVIVGKGVTYDTGGLSLKPTPGSMDLMKCDMAGSAAVAGAMYAIAKAKLNVHVIALVPATDNRPGFNAFAPGDIITMFDGTTIEMLNSDAEGRMILGDALAFAKKYNPELLIDLATLTGAAANAIGPQGIVSMGTADEKVHQKLKESGNNTYERLAEFPFWDEYDELMKSDIADMKNIGGPVAGAITAGKFLAKFTDYPYIHLDIAGPAFITSASHYQTKGATGVGVRLLFDFFKNV